MSPAAPAPDPGSSGGRTKPGRATAESEKSESLRAAPEREGRGCVFFTDAIFTPNVLQKSTRSIYLGLGGGRLCLFPWLGGEGSGEVLPKRTLDPLYRGRLCTAFSKDARGAWPPLVASRPCKSVSPDEDLRYRAGIPMKMPEDGHEGGPHPDLCHLIACLRGGAGLRSPLMGGCRSEGLPSGRKVRTPSGSVPPEDGGAGRAKAARNGKCHREQTAARASVRAARVKRRGKSPPPVQRWTGHDKPHAVQGRTEAGGRLPVFERRRPRVRPHHGASRVVPARGRRAMTAQGRGNLPGTEFGLGP